MYPLSMHVNIPGGARLRLVEWSDGDTVCLLIHGFGDGCHIWNEFAPSIAPYYRTIAVDLRGHGDSDWDPHRRYGVSQHSDDICSVIRGIDSRKLVLVGHSLGAQVAIRTAFAYRHRIRGMVLVDYGPSAEPAAIRQVHADFRAAHHTYQSVEDYAAHLQMQRPLPRPDLLHKIAAESLIRRKDGHSVLKTDPSMARATLDEVDDQGERNRSWEYLKSMRWPVLVVRGEGSAILTRSVANRMTELLQDGALISVRLAGHAVMVDNPEGFATAVIPFLLRLVGQAQRHDSVTSE
jgi:pimeloyl-ACP methyl ester carboxylesterase